MKWMLGCVVAVLGIGLSACGSDGKTATQPGGVAAPPAAAATVAVAQNPAQGSILVDGQGHTLYLFEKDSGTTSACTGACVQVWPALTATAPPTVGAGADAALLGQTGDRVTYAGHLLYTFSGDSAAGDVKGLGIPSWYPVSPSGAKVDNHDDSDSGSSGDGY
jgi:predicted lipoprotein with Yx(FWY)xxD motif